ncbi:hypothetical protein ASF00_07495 [Sphingomonas sp. Leaf34]|uniref:hypothetical protein n=1 Tax=Sphingomonas sp. Leaf34 TaxID=1736216 RepID=UPI0006F5FEE2|nr:hypothetical protein [Sphingomonas sp. Leaf34]KQN30556.1 hypothetical protein ASF00_07495 [Sphingomonas sp. Leaf34]
MRTQCESSDSRYDFDYKAIGGATFNLVPYLFEYLGLEGADYVILEISSCVRFSKTRDGYMRILEEIAGLCQARGAIPCFIQLYRRAIDYSDDPLTDAIQTFASDNRLPCLDLFSAMVEQRNKGTLQTYLRDGTHTADLGTEFYAKGLLQFIDDIVAGDAEGRWTRSGGATSPKVFIPIDTLTDSGEFESFVRGRLKMTYYKLEEGSELKITMPERHVYIGIM